MGCCLCDSILIGYLWLRDRPRFGAVDIFYWDKGYVNLKGVNPINVLIIVQNIRKLPKQLYPHRSIKVH
jgi:hypothetical protein